VIVVDEPILRSISLLLRRRSLFFGASLLASSVIAAEPVRAATPICDGVRIPIDISIFNKPFANLALGSNSGYFLIDTGATLSQIDMRRFAVPEGLKIVLSGFSLPSAEGGVFTAADLSSFAAPLGPQLGTIGTDFLSLRTIQFHYEQSQSFAALGREACDQARLRGARNPVTFVAAQCYYDRMFRGLRL